MITIKNSFVLLVILIICSCSKKNSNYEIVTEDVDNYWEAYDKITATKDSTLQLKYLHELFIDRASIGQKQMFNVRRYTPKEYLDNIRMYPKFWNSIRKNHKAVGSFADEITKGAAKLAQIYPELKPAKVYFTIGAFRSPGTTLDSLVLIGSEMSLTNEHTNTSEFPERLQYFSRYCKNNPIDDVEFLNVHEFVHTQQQSNHDYILIYRAVYEGIAEFVAEKATNQKSIQPSLKYGAKHDARLKEKFVKQLYSRGAVDDWLYNGVNNEFGMNDLGYYMGYAIASRYYDKQEDKSLAIKTIIELDYSNNAEFENFVNSSGYFHKPLTELKKEYEDNLPYVIDISPFKNGDQQVSPGKKQITVRFSKPMQSKTDFELGPLGLDHLMRVQKMIGFSEDGTTLTFEVELTPNKRYQLLLNNSNFKDTEGVRMQPYLIDFKTQ